MRQRHGFTSWYCALCICAIGLVLDQVAWAQVPNETYDFNITKGIVEFSRGHYAQATDLFEQARLAVPNDPEATEYLGQTLNQPAGSCTSLVGGRHFAKLPREVSRGAGIA